MVDKYGSKDGGGDAGYQRCGRVARQQGQKNWDDRVYGRLLRQQICRTMRKEAAETWEDKIGHIGRKIVDGVPLSRAAAAASMDLSPYPAEERSMKNHPTHHIGCGITTTEMAYRLDYPTRDCSSRSWQWQQLTAATERGRRYQLAQRESNKRYKTKLTPLPVDPRKLYFTPLMFAHFVCALSGFHEREFPKESKTREPGKISWNAPRILYIILFIVCGI